MNTIPLCLIVSLFLVFGSCTVQLTSVKEKSAEQIKAGYRVIRDVSYGPDQEQGMDIYISGYAKKLKRKNFTVVFVHGGGYYVSDKSKEEKYIEPYLKKGMNVVSINYRLKRGIPVATEDLTTALHFLQSNNAEYPLNLSKVILTGFSAGAHIASNVAVSANNPEYPYRLDNRIKISGIINFSGPVDGVDVVEKVFIDHDVQIMKDIGNALFPNITGYAPGDTIAIYEPITYFDQYDPPFFLWYGGKDDQIPPSTFTKFVDLLNQDKNKNEVIYIPEGFHDPNPTELTNAYASIFLFLDQLK